MQQDSRIRIKGLGIDLFWAFYAVGIQMGQSQDTGWVRWLGAGFITNTILVYYTYSGLCYLDLV